MGLPETTISHEEVLRRIVAKITPAIVEIVQRRDSGRIELHFGSGDFKMATYQRSL
jgi:hypothetical protein